MKKLILALIAVLCLVFSNETDAQIRYGVKGGFQLTNVQYYHPISSSRTGFQVGGLAYIPINDSESLYFQPELLYLQHGEQNKGDYRGENISEKYNLDYIALPLMLKAYISDHYNTFYVEVGPQIAYLINQKSSTNRTELAALTDYGVDGDNTSKIDLSVGLGIGFSFQRQWELGVRYNYGFSDVYPDTVGENDAKTNNTSNLSFGLLYIFD